MDFEVIIYGGGVTFFIIILYTYRSGQLVYGHFRECNCTIPASHCTCLDVKRHYSACFQRNSIWFGIENIRKQTQLILDGIYLALNSDRSISLILFSVASVCVCSIVNVTYVWKGIAQRSGSLYIKSYKENSRHRTFSRSKSLRSLRTNELTNKLTPATSRHFSTGSA